MVKDTPDDALVPLLPGETIEDVLNAEWLMCLPGQSPGPAYYRTWEGKSAETS